MLTKVHVPLDTLRQTVELGLFTERRTAHGKYAGRSVLLPLALDNGKRQSKASVKAGRP